ncbi:hypothetical protein [Acetobacter pasteurianus]|nr:hypothetical protein [Acetobacter pasteurianus]
MGNFSIWTTQNIRPLTAFCRNKRSAFNMKHEALTFLFSDR